jgi:hypothetical protein
MKQFKQIIFSTLLAVFVFVSCTEDFEEINQDPNNPTAIPSHLLLPSVARQFQNTNYSTFVGGDLAGWAGQLAKVQYNDEQRYIPRTSVINSTWNNTYAISISDASSMYKLGKEEGNNNMMGVALTLQAYGYAMLTDIYGNIPFTEAMKGDEGITTPIYDSQEVVYDGVLSYLDQAIALLGTGGTIDATSDIIYQGDASKWKKFATSLKFRSLMRISGKRDVSADLKALVSSGNLFTSNSEEAKLIYLSASPSANPLFETIVFGTRGEWKVNKVLVEMLQNLNDPRLPIYVQQNDAGIYRGKPSGIDGLPNNEYDYANVSAIGTKYLEAEAPGYFISNAELKFLMAEAAEKGLINGSSQAFYNQGVDSSFEFNGLSQAEADAYKATNSVTLSPIQAQALQQIGNQKWLSIFTQGTEAWTEQRRTGFPVLPVAIDAVLSQIPSRLTYPPLEGSINATNYKEAVAAQGADLLTTKVWWNN